MFDFHVHSYNSPDSVQDVKGICDAAILKGLDGFALTDHADMYFSDFSDTQKRIENSVKCVDEARRTYGDKIRIYKGIELGEYTSDAESAEKLINSADFDAVLGSVHIVGYKNLRGEYYSQTDFSKYSGDDIHCFMRQYFCDVLEMAKCANFDILTHLTCPLRYITGRYGRRVDLSAYSDIIDEIFYTVIGRNIALEVNTSGVGTPQGFLMPDVPLIKHYFEAGGRMITLGSDAHICGRMSNAFDSTAKLLRSIGFDRFYIFEKRKPKAY